jgi:hypothetical protein
VQLWVMNERRTVDVIGGFERWEIPELDKMRETLLNGEGGWWPAETRGGLVFVPSMSLCRGHEN